MEGQNKKGKDRLMCLEILKHQERLMNSQAELHP